MQPKYETNLYVEVTRVSSLIIDGFVTLDPIPLKCGEEARYKRMLIAAYRLNGFDAYCIENEEKEPGWPDLLVTRAGDNRFLLVETKVSNDSGTIKFEKTQPHFYARSIGKLPVHILAFNVRTQRTVLIPPSAVVQARSLKMSVPDFIPQAHYFGHFGYVEVVA